MDHSIIFSRRDTDRKVDFRPDMEPGSPDEQARRLSHYLGNGPRVFTEDNITDCPEALDALREYQYRKIFGGTTHEDFLALDKTDPEHIDWMVRIHEIASASFKAKTR